MSHPTSPSDAAGALPDVVQRYLRTHDDRDTDATLRTFGPTAEVTDEGATRRGLDQIRHWLETTSAEYSFERTLLDAFSDGDDRWVVLDNITGNFPGGTVDLTYRFTLRDGLIQQLVIAPSQGA